MKSIQFFIGRVNRTILLGLLSMLCLNSAQAQFLTAASYPFTASVKTFNYLSGGTNVAFPFSYDDDFYPNVPIGFTFTFCGVPYTTVTAMTNGYMKFGNATSYQYPAVNSYLSNTNVTPCMMAGWHDCIGQANSVSYLTTGTAPNRKFTLEFKNWGTWSGNSQYVTYQYILYEGGPLELMYKEEGAGGFGSTSSTTAIGIATSPTDYQSLNNVSTSPVSSSTVFTNTISGKPTTGQSYLWGQIPCTGVPTTSVAAANEVCPNKPFTATLSGLSIYSDITYQWQKSTNGTTWTNFTGAGATSVTITDIISAPTWYRAIVVCNNSGQTFTTAPKYIGIAPFYYCYCDGSKANSGTGADIGNVKIQGESNGAVKLNNGNASPLLSNTNSKQTYSDFRYTVPAVPVYRDSSYVFTVSQITSATNFTSAIAAIFIDYNRNGRFEDTIERVLLAPTANTLPTPGVVLDTFRIPDTAGIGLTGMRVILRTGTINPDTCGLYTDGETEDYLLDIRYEPCDGPVNQGTVVTTDTTMCPGYWYSIADTTHERKKSDITWWWQYSPDGLVWANLPNSVNKDTFNNVVFSNTIYYRVKMVCQNTHDTTTTTATKIAEKAAYKCYCYSFADGNIKNDIDTSDIGAVGLSSMLVTNNGPHMGNEFAIRSREDHTDMVPLELETERRYRLLVYHTMNRNDHADAKVTVFMDFNNNKQYDIPQERVGTWFTSINSHTIIDSIYIPDSTIVNVPTGMRVILNNNVAPNLQSDYACGTYTSGETEDFIIMFKRPIVTGVQIVKGISNLGLYPNPTGGKFRIQFDGAGKNILVTVSTATGQQVEQRTYNHKGGLFSEEMDMSSHAKGVYFVELQADGEKMTRKLVVQ